MLSTYTPLGKHTTTYKGNDLHCALLLSHVLVSLFSIEHPNLKGAHLGYEYHLGHLVNWATMDKRSACKAIDYKDHSEWK